MPTAGLSMNATPHYLLASFRYFGTNEHHISRTIPENVLLLGISGILCFTEDGIPIEVREGEYYIQKGGLPQAGPLRSVQPVYFYVHFWGEWTTNAPTLSRQGRFDVENMMPLLKKLAQLEQTDATLVEKNEVLCRILSTLYHIQNQATDSMSAIVEKMIRQMVSNLQNPPTLELFSNEFHFSTNYLIRIFRETTGYTPHAYLSNARLRQARLLLETTNATAEDIALSCGFSDYPHFYRMFKGRFGMSPMQYRNWYRTYACPPSI